MFLCVALMPYSISPKKERNMDNPNTNDAEQMAGDDEDYRDAERQRATLLTLKMFETAVKIMMGSSEDKHVMAAAILAAHEASAASFLVWLSRSVDPAQTTRREFVEETAQRVGANISRMAGGMLEADETGKVEIPERVKAALEAFGIDYGAAGEG